MKGRGDALMGIGFGEGSNRAVDAARAAISNPLLENASIDGAKSVLVNLSGGDNLTLQEYQDVVEIITENCAEDALIIAGQAFNPELGDRIKVTVVATGFERKDDVVGAEVGADIPRRKFESVSSEPKAAPVSAAAAASAESPEQHGKPASPAANNDAEVITVNRWQDLQQQLGKRQPGNDYSFPAVLRYSRGENEDN